VNVFCLGPEQIDSLWDEYSQHIYRMERLGHLGADEVRDELKLAKKQLWGIQDGPKIVGICITRVTGKCCEIFAAAGTQSKRGQILELYNHVERWARDIGCTRMRVIGRKGWMRMLKGYLQTGIVLEKELDDEQR
jgi:hypothetical protein